jgi:hypothetical protein
MEAKLNVFNGKLHGRQLIYRQDGTISMTVFYNYGSVMGIIFFEKHEEIVIDLVKMTRLQKYEDFTLFSQINEHHRSNGEWRLQWKNADISLSGFRRDGKYSKDGWIFTLKGVEYPVVFDSEKNEWIGDKFAIDAQTFSISEFDMIAMTCCEELQDFKIVAQIDIDRKPNGAWRLQWKTSGTSLSGFRRDGKYSKDGWIFTLKGVEYPVVFDSEKNEWIGDKFAIDVKTFAIFELI